MRTPLPSRLPCAPSSLALVTVLAVLTVRAAFAAGAGEGWNQFRGPGGQGLSQAKGIPVSWGESENVKWKTPIHGKSWSSPVLLGEHVWLTTAPADGKQLFAVCVEQATGKIVHDLKLFDVPNPQFCHAFNSYASPSPVVEQTPSGGRVYVTFGSPGTACLDAATGKVLWERRDFVCNHFRGSGSSPLLYKDTLILNFDGSDFQYVVALNKTTGETVWKTDRSIDFQDLDANGKPKMDGDMRKAFSTPRVATFGGQEILISAGSKALYAYEPATGKELWRLENRGAHSSSSTPVIGKDLIYWCCGHGKAELIAVKPGGSGVLKEDMVAFRLKKNVPTRSSPLLVDDLLYLVDDGGIASCVEAATGNEVWKQRLGKGYSASPTFIDGRVYFFSEDGSAHVIQPGRELKILAESKLDDGFMASPAVADGALFLRTKTSLYRVQQGGK